MSNNKHAKDIKLNELIEQIYDNALDDREKAIDLFDDLYTNLNGQMINHANAGLIIAKYLERLNKVNDQLLKLAEMIQVGNLEEKRQNTKSMTDNDKEEIFEMIKKREDD